MLEQDISIDAVTEVPPRVSNFRRFIRVFLSRGVVIFGLFFIVLMVVTAIFAPLIAPYDPYAIDREHRLVGPSTSHLLGTDSLGRDTFSRIIYGSRISLMVSIVALLLAATVGMSLGLIAGFFGGITYAIIMRVIDAMMSIPMMVLALTIAALMGGGLFNIIVALGVSLVPTYARLMCGQALSIKQNDYIHAGRMQGASNTRLMLRHVFPNCMPPLIVMMTLQLGTTVLAEAGLSFLGIGIKPPTASWGGMIFDGYEYLTQYPLLSFAPGVAIMLVVFSFNMVGDGLRDAVDPRLRGVI